MSSVPDTSLLHLLHRASQVADEAFSALCPDLTPRQYVVLSAVKQGDGVSQQVLVERTGIDRSTLADVIRRLVSSGHAKRKRSKQDARAYRVTLTAKGEADLARGRAAAHQVDGALHAALKGKLTTTFSEQLKALVNSRSAAR